MSNDMTSGPAAGRGHRLPTDMREDWEPYEIVYARYTRDPGDPAGEVIGLPSSYVVCRTDIKAFVADRLKNLPLPDYVLKRHKHKDDPHKPGPKSIDIYVGCPCYVVIELDAALAWHFRTGEPGITTATDHGAANGALHHVMPDGTILGDKGPDRDGCRMLYFGMNERGAYEHQKFLCHIDFGKGLEDPDPVTPDIPNDGGKFPMFPRSPCLGTETPSADD